MAPLMFALCALTSLLLLNYIAKQLGTLVGKGLEWTVIAEFLLLSVPFTVAMTLPMAVLVATLYAISRLTSENEISAMKANGVAMGSLLVPIAVGAVILAFVMVGFNDQLLPRANHRLKTLQNDIARKKPTFALKETVLNPVLNLLTIRADRIDRGASMLTNVHMYDIAQPHAVRNIHADSAHIALTPDQKDLVLTLYDGYVIDVNRTHPASMNRVYFLVNRLRVKDVGNELKRVQQDEYKGEREQSICEMTDKYDREYELYAAARMRIKAQMVFLAAEATRGGSAMYKESDSSPPIKRQTTWGSVYCSAVQRLARVLPGAGVIPPDSAAADSAAAANSPDRVKDVPEAPAAVVTPGVNAQGVAADVPPPPSREYYFMSAAQLGESLGSQLVGTSSEITTRKRGMNRFAVEIHKKFALAGACIVFVLIGVPFALRFPRGGVGFVIGTSLVIFAVSYVGLIAGEALADRNTLSPFLAMWGANFVLALVGIGLLLRMGRESMTRGTTLALILADIRDWFRRGRQ